MALVYHKHMPQSMPPEELRESFAVREGELDALVEHLRSFDAAAPRGTVITGGIGIGKSTLILRLIHRLQSGDEHAGDVQLKKGWIPIRFGEELPYVTSLRDLLFEAFQIAAEASIAPGAADAATRLLGAKDDAEAYDFAEGSLQELRRQIDRESPPRFLFVVENLDLVLRDALADDESLERWERLLCQPDPPFAVLGSSTRLNLEFRPTSYFTNKIELKPLDSKQVLELITARATFDGTMPMARPDSGECVFNIRESTLRAITLITGGNPRLCMVLYEILSENATRDSAQLLKRLVDEITPEMRRLVLDLAPQQRKILHVLIKRQMTSVQHLTPTEIADATGFPTPTVNKQLGRLCRAGIISLQGGGSGKRVDARRGKAQYRIEDPLLRAWYIVRYSRHPEKELYFILQTLERWFEKPDRADALHFASGISNIGRGLSVLWRSLDESDQGRMRVPIAVDQEGASAGKDQQGARGILEEARTKLDEGDFEVAESSASRVLENPSLGDQSPELIYDAQICRALALGGLGGQHGSQAESALLRALEIAPTPDFEAWARLLLGRFRAPDAELIQVARDCLLNVARSSDELTGSREPIYLSQIELAKLFARYARQGAVKLRVVAQPLLGLDTWDKNALETAWDHVVAWLARALEGPYRRRDELFQFVFSSAIRPDNPRAIDQAIFAMKRIQEHPGIKREVARLCEAVLQDAFIRPEESSDLIAKLLDADNGDLRAWSRVQFARGRLAGTQSIDDTQSRFEVLEKVAAEFEFLVDDEDVTNTGSTFLRSRVLIDLGISRILLSEIHDDKKHLDDALEVLDLALSEKFLHRSLRVVALGNRGTVHLRLERDPEGLADIKEVLECADSTEPAFVDAAALLSLHSINVGDKDRFENHVRRFHERIRKLEEADRRTQVIEFLYSIAFGEGDCEWADAKEWLVPEKSNFSVYEVFDAVADFIVKKDDTIYRQRLDDIGKRLAETLAQRLGLEDLQAPVTSTPREL